MAPVGQASIQAEHFGGHFIWGAKSAHSSFASTTKEASMMKDPMSSAKATVTNSLTGCSAPVLFLRRCVMCPLRDRNACRNVNVHATFGDSSSADRG